MPTILTHPAVPLTIAWGLGREVISTRLLAVEVIASVVPDLDVLAFRFGIPYAAELGHRGFSHSLLLALIIAVVGASLVRPLHTTLKLTFWFLFVSVVSHGILDALTNGGLGIAFLWPFSGERFFAPFQPIVVAPLGLSRFLSLKGVAVLWSEILWVWLPFSCVAAISVVFRRHRALALLSSRTAHKRTVL
jgi:inner membrane protein